MIRKKWFCYFLTSFGMYNEMKMNFFWQKHAYLYHNYNSRYGYFAGIKHFLIIVSKWGDKAENSSIKIWEILSKAPQLLGENIVWKKKQSVLWNFTNTGHQRFFSFFPISCSVLTVEILIMDVENFNLVLPTNLICFPINQISLISIHVFLYE